MAEKSETLSQARAVLQRTLMTAAGELAAMDQGASAHSIADLALQITTLQAGIEALDRAPITADRHQPTYSSGLS
jgi:hypothetical protein